MNSSNQSRQTTVVVLGSLIVILGLSSLILFFQNRLLRQQMTAQENLTTPAPSPTVLVSPYVENSTTYINQKYNFTLTPLPDKLKIIVCGDVDQGDNPQTANDIWFMEPDIIDYYKKRDKTEGIEGYLICGPIDSQRGPIGITIEEKEFTPTKNSKEVIVGGIKAYQTNTKNQGGPGPDEIITTQFFRNNFTYSITLYLNNNEYIKEYDQILSTFKFIEDTSGQPTLTSPISDSIVSSPLTVSGTAPMGWMFEGQLVIKLLDSQKKLITQTAGKEKVPGSWQSGKPADFTGTLIFTTSESTGFLVIEADNPSGLPENAKSYEIPVKFK